MITQIEIDAMHAIIYMPKVLGEIADHLKKIACVLEKMERTTKPGGIRNDTEENRIA